VNGLLGGHVKLSSNDRHLELSSSELQAALLTVLWPAEQTSKEFIASHMQGTACVDVKLPKG